MPLNTQSFASFVNNYVNQFATQVGIEPVLTPGDPVLALAEASSAEATFLQFQAQYTCNFARVTTCSGPDVDSFFAQFNFPRIGASYASGEVTLGVSAPLSIQIVIPVGTIVQTLGGNIQYQLVADTNQAAYNLGLNAYVFPASTSMSPVLTITASVQALVAGSNSNVQAGQLVQFGSSAGGVTSVTNLAPILNGSNQESDAAYKARFILYINSLSKGTYDAILEACESVFPDFTYSILSNINPYDIATPGWFTVVANNAGETVSSPQLNSLQNAINSIRAFTIQFSVVGAIPVTPTIAMNISVNPNAVALTVQDAAQTAIIGYVNSLLSGQKLYLSDIVDAAMNSSTDILSVQFSSVLINGEQTDLAINEFHTAQANLESVSVGIYDG